MRKDNIYDKLFVCNQQWCQKINKIFMVDVHFAQPL